MFCCSCVLFVCVHVYLFGVCVLGFLCCWGVDVFVVVCCCFVCVVVIGLRYCS